MNHLKIEITFRTFIAQIVTKYCQKDIEGVVPGAGDPSYNSLIFEVKLLNFLHNCFGGKINTLQKDKSR